MREKTNSESKQDANTMTDSPNIDKQVKSNRKEPLTNYNQNTTHPNHTKGLEEWTEGENTYRFTQNSTKKNKLENTGS